MASLVGAIDARLEEVADSFHRIGTVTGVAGARANVNVAGGTLNLGYPTTYTPVIGDVVQVIGRPGSQFIVCKLA